MATSTNGHGAADDDDNQSLPLSSSDLKQQVRIRMGSSGQAALPTQTVLQVFQKTVARIPNTTALSQKRPKTGQTAAQVPWTTWTWKEYQTQVYAFGKALLTLDFQPFDTINIIGFNAPEWFFANLGVMAAGGVSAGIYTTNEAEACFYISHHSKAKVVVCEGLKQLQKYATISSRLVPHLKAIVVYGLHHNDDDDDDDDNNHATIPADLQTKCSVPVYTFEEFIKLGDNNAANTAAQQLDQLLEERMQAWKPGHCCSLIYTSGTTGPPKAVMITHDNITWQIHNLLLSSRRGYLTEQDCMISYLPLSHVAAQMLDIYAPLGTGIHMYFAQPDALKGSLGATLKEVRPTIFFGVPRVWEKIYEKLQEVAKSTTGIKKVLSTWAKSEALAYWESMEYNALKSFSLTRMLPVSYYAARVLLSKAHQALGFDRCVEFYVSAAPMEVKILRYFMSLDIPIMELFGQSECTGPHSVNTYAAFVVGSVGRPMPGTQTKRDAETGELIYTGRHIFAGYMGMPDKTKETIDPEGWLHSGDVIAMDDNNDPRIEEGPSGFISITGRIKELIITAGGENIPPVLIEDELKAAMPALSNAMVIGDKRKFLTVLFCLKVVIDEEGVATSTLAPAAREAVPESDAKTTKEVEQDPKWKNYFEKGIAAANEKATSRAQRVAKYALVPTDFTEKGGELTPTLKLKRSVTADKYKAIIDAMYA
ncbi:hypothetical protein ACA910_012441 [Epithemia clementina (nom. ined.)]